MYGALRGHLCDSTAFLYGQAHGQAKYAVGQFGQTGFYMDQI